MESYVLLFLSVLSILVHVIIIIVALNTHRGSCSCVAGCTLGSKQFVE